MAKQMRSKTSLLAGRKTLMLLAVALLAATLAMLFSMYRTEPLKEFLVAKRDLPSGTQLSATDFERLPVDLNERVYLSELLPDASIAQALRRGELVPFSALGAVDGRQAIVLLPTQPISDAIRAGSRVDVWFVAKSAGQGASVPQRVGTALEVLSISRPTSDTSFATDSLRLEVAVSPPDLPALMLASADGGFIGVVGNR
jgi:Flp pilus assembly protein CpaB